MASHILPPTHTYIHDIISFGTTVISIITQHNIRWNWTEKELGSEFVAGCYNHMDKIYILNASLVISLHAAFSGNERIGQPPPYPHRCLSVLSRPPVSGLKLSDLWPLTPPPPHRSKAFLPSGSASPPAPWGLHSSHSLGFFSLSSSFLLALYSTWGWSWAKI